jgi:hypothetical protein
MQKTALVLGLCLTGSLILAGCASTPAPLGAEDALVVVLTMPGDIEAPARLSLQGPAALALDLPFGSSAVHLIRALPGDYEVSVPGVAALPARFSVEPGTVTLFPYFFSRAGGVLAARPVTAPEQALAAKLLLDHIGVQAWFDRRYAGFGNARPKMFLTGKLFPLSIITDPPGASLSIDNAPWGETPKQLELAAGKYLIQIGKPGYTGIRRYLTVSGPVEETFKLERTTARSVTDAKNRFTLMIYPFINLDDPKFNPYGTVFQGSLRALFSKGRRYQVMETAGKAEASGAGEYPDLAIAERGGAELAITGKYRELNNEIFVYAALYDVKSRRVKYADTYTGEAGFAVFGSIDALSQDFARAADKTLPEPGQPVLEAEGDPRNALVSFEKELFREQAIDDYVLSPQILSFSLGLAGTMDDIQGVSGRSSRSSPLGPINSLDVAYEFVFTPEFSLFNSFTFNLELNDKNPAAPVTFSMFLNTGPKLSFRSEKNDISVSLLLAAGFAPGITVEDMGAPVDVGPYVYLGGKLGIGYRYFFQNRLSERPYFLTASLIMDLAVFRFNFDGYSPLFVPLSLGLYAGWGFAL